MEKNKYKEKHMAMPIEEHDTAAWANTEEVKPVSGVMKPDDIQVDDARDYVNENEK